MAIFRQQTAILYPAQDQLHCSDIPKDRTIATAIADIVASAVTFRRRGPIELVTREVCTETGFKTFDRQTNCITSGNVIANTMFGQVIRPRCEADHAGNIGGLQAFDLQQMRRFGAAGLWVLNAVAKLPVAETEQVTAYIFFISEGSQRTSIGAFLVDQHRNFISQSTTTTPKRAEVLDAMAITLSNLGILHRERVIEFTDSGTVVYRDDVSEELARRGLLHQRG